MYDCHIHCALSSVRRHPKGLMASDSPERRSFFMKILQKYQQSQIEGIRDGGDSYGAGRIFKLYCQEAGIHYLTPIHALYRKGCYGDFLGLPVDAAKDGVATIRSLKKQKADFIKIIATGIMDFKNYGQVSDTGFSGKTLKILVDCAHDEGLKVMVHVNTPRAILTAVQAGSDTIEHGYMISDDCIAAMKEYQTIWVPTLAPFANMAGCSDAHFLSPYRNVCARYFNDHKKAVERAFKAGVAIAPGSDAGSTLVAHGTGSLNEYAYLHECGISREKANQAAEKIFNV